MTEPRLRAFEVTEDYESHAMIVYARHAVTARRIGAAELADGEFSNVTCRRAPWADAYAPGPVPAKALYEAGWWLECRGCERWIDDDDDPRPVFVGTEAYCTAQCHERLLADQAQERLVRDATIRDLSRRLLQLMPGALICGDAHVYVPRGKAEPEQGYIEFTFPGARWGTGSLRFDKAGQTPLVVICNGDRTAFRLWRAAGYPPHLMDALL